MKYGLREVSAYLYVLAEAFAWFIVLLAIGTAVVRNSFDRLVFEITPLAASPGNGQATSALAIARDGAAHAVGGPSLLIVLVTAFGAFALVRALAGSGFPTPLAAIVGLAATMIALHVLVHVAVYGNFRIWEQSALVAALDSTSTGKIAGADFVVRPDARLVEQDSMLLVALLGISAAWVRFLVAARGAVTYERALRSFSIGFSVVLMAAILSQSVTDAPAALALGYFVFGALSLAAAHMARTRGADNAGRDAPMALAALATLGVVVAVALVFGLLAVLDVQRAFNPLIDLLLAGVGRVLLFLLTPVFWVVDWVLSHVLARGGAELPEAFRRLGEDTIQRDEKTDGRFLPGWSAQLIRVLLIAAFAWLIYRASRLIFHLTRPRDLRAPGDEVRSTASGGGVASLLRGLFGNRAGQAWSGDWLRRHAVYRLYARVVTLAWERNIERAPGETPIEFADRAGAALRAPAFERVGAAFDAARYGRHYPDAEGVESLERALTSWERQSAAAARDASDTPPRDEDASR